MERPYDAIDGEQAVEEQLRHLEGGPEVGYNVAEEALYRHAGDRPALVWRSGDQRRVVTYGELSKRAEQMAGILHARGVGPGTPVAVLLPKRPELLETLFAIWHLGATLVPLFTAFGPSAIKTRVASAGAKLLVTESELTERLPDDEELDVLDVDQLTDDQVADGAAVPEPTRHPAGSTFILIFTSGTTGPPKGVPVPLHALPAFRSYLDYSVDLRDDDKFWNMADPGWAYGLYYGVVGPMLMGHTIRFLQEKFDAERAAAFAREEGVTNMLSAPTAYRAVVPHLKGAEFRVASSAGGPLSADLAEAFREATGAPLRDHYGQSEVGMVVGNHHRLTHEVHPGSMGLPNPGFQVAVLGEDGQPVVGEPGALAVNLESSPMNFFRGYHNVDDNERILDDGWYLTGDLAIHHSAGHFSFASRSDDVISTAGYRVGPSEIEEPLRRHPEVVDCAVVGRPDEERGEVIVAFVVPRSADAEPDQLLDELRTYVKREVAAHLAPREVHVVDEIPQTPSGKAQRFVLRQRLTDE